MLTAVAVRDRGMDEPEALPCLEPSVRWFFVTLQRFSVRE